MTSLEALYIIEFNSIMNGIPFNREIEVIKQDLEVLEILKNESDNKTIIIEDGIATFHIDMVLDCNTYPCIKEWIGDKAHIIER